MEQTTGPGPDHAVPPAPGPQASGTNGFFDSVRRTGLVRTQDRWLGGVAGGVARRFGIDPLLVRGILVVTVVLGGAGLVVYGLGWALLPEESDGRIHLQETVRGRFDAAVLGALAAVIIGLNRGSGWGGWWWDENGLGWVNGLLWTAATVAVIVLIISAVNGRDRSGRADASTASRAAWRTVPHPGYGAVPATAGSAPAGSPVPPPPPYAATTTPPPPPAAVGTRPLASGGPGAPSGWSGPAAPWPSAPPKPRVEGPGVGAVGAVVGLTLLALAGLLVVEREGELGQPVLLTALGIGIVLAGLGIIVSGLRGRSSGTLGFLAIVGIIAAVPVSAATLHDDRFFFGDDDRIRIADGTTWRPQTVAEARRGVSASFGDVNVDLTDVPLGEGTVRVPISLGAGDLEVVVPEDVAVIGDIDLTAGQVTWDIDGRSSTAGFSGGGPERYTSDEAADGDPVELALEIRAGAGDVRVQEEDR